MISGKNLGQSLGLAIILGSFGFIENIRQCWPLGNLLRWKFLLVLQLMNSLRLHLWWRDIDSEGENSVYSSNALGLISRVELVNRWNGEKWWNWWIGEMVNNDGGGNLWRWILMPGPPRQIPFYRFSNPSTTTNTIACQGEMWICPRRVLAIVDHISHLDLEGVTCDWLLVTQWKNHWTDQTLLFVTNSTINF